MNHAKAVFLSYASQDADAAAYDLYLKAREIGRGTIAALEERQTLLEDAVRLV